MNEKTLNCASYNMMQEPCNALRSLRGSIIERCREYGVGKKIGGSVYFHRDYVSRVVPGYELQFALNIIEQNYPGFKYNCITYEKSKGKITFVEAPDFDTAREPTVGYYVSVNLNTGDWLGGYSAYIWHHKWLWVRDDYKGFDVKESWNWSRTWLNAFKPSADHEANNGIASGVRWRWKEQLEYYGLTQDKE